MYMVETGNSLFQQQTDESLERNARGIHTISCLAAPALPAAYICESKMHTLYLLCAACEIPHLINARARDFICMKKEAALAAIRECFNI
jgi:hypothetical protein